MCKSVYSPFLKLRAVGVISVYFKRRDATYSVILVVELQGSRPPVECTMVTQRTEL